MHRTFPLTIWIAAAEAAIGLHAYLVLLERVVDFYEFMTTSLNFSLLRVVAINFDKLK